MKDFYYILGVDANCTLDEIKDAYRKLSKKFHPDLNDGDAYFEDRFKEINEAYETLSDQDKRYRYDEALKQFKSKPSGEGQKRQRYYYYHDQNEHRRRQTRRSAAMPKRRPGVGMSVILILVALIVSVYIVESFSNSSKKASVTKGAVAVSPAPSKTHKHHKKKHGLKNTAADSSALSANNIPQKPVNVPAVKPLQANNKPPEAARENQPPPVIKKQEDNKPFLYAAYVRANITGVINMRKAAAYSSDVIATIPANAKVFVLQKGADYDKISYNNITGYVPQWSIRANK
jgi:curved DNA-binding protein CbpA